MQPSFSKTTQLEENLILHQEKTNLKPTTIILTVLVLTLPNIFCYKRNKIEIPITEIELKAWVHPEYVPPEYDTDTINNEVLLDLTKNRKLIATIQPSNATNKEIKWSSNNPRVATVNNGIVTAHTYGRAIITVTTNNGKTASLPIACYEPYETLLPPIPDTTPPKM
jgi:hypothetical protein